MTNLSKVKTRKAKKDSLENATQNVQAVMFDMKDMSSNMSSLLNKTTDSKEEIKATETKSNAVKFDMFDKKVTAQFQASALMKSDTKNKKSEKSQTENVRLTSFKLKNNVINRTFVVETALNVASRTLDKVTCQQIVLFIEQVLTLTSFKYKRETSNVQRVRNHIKDTIRLETATDCYSFDEASQTITFTKEFLAENRKNQVHVTIVDNDMKEVIAYAKTINHVIS